jgi:3'-phosphoadenosine 5'-phosphosulfate sulfotransferase (PAPS reductase)/FAD synthetase
MSQILNQDWDHVIVNISGGKDSTALINWALWNFPKEKIHLVHARIDIDWSVTEEIVNEQAAHYGLPVTIVQAVKADGQPSGFIRQLTSARVNRKTGKVGEYQFPDMGNRWCTSMLKTAPIAKFVRKLSGRILNCLGERREESTQRSKLEEVRPDVKLSKKGREVVTVSPILDMLEQDVWDSIEKSGAPVHPCYSWGVPRASCAICIFSSEKDIKIAAEREPELVQKYMDAEASIEHSFRYKAATKTRPEQRISVADILAR